MGLFQHQVPTCSSAPDLLASIAGRSEGELSREDEVPLGHSPDTRPVHHPQPRIWAT